MQACHSEFLTFIQALQLQGKKKPTTKKSCLTLLSSSAPEWNSVITFSSLMTWVFPLGPVNNGARKVWGRYKWWRDGEIGCVWERICSKQWIKETHLPLADKWVKSTVIFCLLVIRKTQVEIYTWPLGEIWGQSFLAWLFHCFSRWNQHLTMAVDQKSNIIV